MNEEEKEKGAGSHTDNNLSQVQKVMKDNNIPFFYSEDDDDETDD